MRWDDLRFVLALARAGTMSGAAAHLEVNHTTVSRRIQALEGRLGVRLFDKLPDGYHTTNAGDEVVEMAERIEVDVHAIDRRLLGRDQELSGKLRVASLELMADMLSPDLVDFRDRYPDVELEVTVGYHQHDLGRREADVAIRISNDPPDSLVGRRVGRMEFALYAAESLLSRMGRSAELSAYPWLGWDKRLGARLTERWIDDNAPGARVVCRLDSTVVMGAALRAGMGLGFLPVAWGGRYPELTRLRPVERNFGMDIWLLTHADLRRVPRIRAFIDHMAPAIRRLWPPVAP